MQFVGFSTRTSGITVDVHGSVWVELPHLVVKMSIRVPRLQIMFVLHDLFGRTVKESLGSNSCFPHEYVVSTLVWYTGAIHGHFRKSGWKLWDHVEEIGPS